MGPVSTLTRILLPVNTNYILKIRVKKNININNHRDMLIL